MTNYFSPSTGGVLCPDCRQTQPFTYPISVNALKVLRLLQGSDYDTANRLKLNAQLSRELETIMRSYLKHLLERDLKSAGWLDTLQEQKAQT